MKHHPNISIIALLLTIVALAALRASPAEAQSTTPGAPQPVDMMMVIDNSCSMFPKEKDGVPIACADVQSDPNALRIVGANLFIARLGFSESNEDAYQLGVISFGEGAQLLSPLAPLKAARDTLSTKIADPQPQNATQIVEALKLAYQQLRESPNRRPGNQPAVVLITDGVPYPKDGQSNDDIEKLIKANDDIPLFIMLLQASDNPAGDYKTYIDFWNNMSATYRKHIFTYTIKGADQIEQTYRQIISQLQNTVPTDGTVVTPGQPLPIFVDRYVRKLIVTVRRSSPSLGRALTITDPNSKVVQDADPGVEHFLGAINPFEVIAIGAPRLGPALKDKTWQITSTQPVTVSYDRQGAYQIKFRSPHVTLTEITNNYLAIGRQPSAKPLSIQFALVDIDSGAVITDQQPLQGSVKLPDGRQEPWSIDADISPDSQGVYTVPFDLLRAYPAVRDTQGQFTFVLNAGSADRDSADKLTPIATARLLVDAGPGPFIAQISPQPFACGSGRSTQLTVNVGEANTAQPKSIHIRILGNGDPISLDQQAEGVFGADLSSFCAELVKPLLCSVQATAPLQVQLDAQLADGTALTPILRDLPTQLNASPCAPTPTTAPPPPPPTPIPDRDHDGLNDLVDACPNSWGPAFLSGCTPIWAIVVAGLVGLGLLWLLIFQVAPILIVRYIAPPPRGGVKITQPGQAPLFKNLYNVGLSRRTSRIRIGGDKKRDHIYIKGFKPSEFIAQRDGAEAVLVDPVTGAVKARFGKTPTPVNTSLVGSNLQICADMTRLT